MFLRKAVRFQIENNKRGFFEIVHKLQGTRLFAQSRIYMQSSSVWRDGLIRLPFYSISLVAIRRPSRAADHKGALAFRRCCRRLLPKQSKSLMANNVKTQIDLIIVSVVQDST